MTARSEVAPTGRAKCRGCGAPIGKGERRIGDVFANPFAEDQETTHWYHPLCAAYKRPEVLLAALDVDPELATGDPRLEPAARLGTAHRRLPRIDGAERAPSGRASCRACKQKIEQRSWRIRLVYFEAGRFEPSGAVHAGCAASYFEHGDLLARVRHFSPVLDDAAAADLARALATASS